MTDPNYLFRSGPLSVTPAMLRFRGRRYKLAHIENLILKRPLFHMGLLIASLIAGFISFNADILFTHEMVVASLTACAIPAILWPLGTLQIQSRTLSVDGSSITWLHRDLAAAQTVIEETVCADDRNAII